MSEQDEPRIAMCQQCNGEGYFYGDEIPVRCSTSDAVTQLAMRQTAQIAGLIAERDALRVENERLRDALRAYEQHFTSSFTGPNADKHERASLRGAWRKHRATMRATMRTRQWEAAE